jgi:hypothetical protein
LRRVGFDRLEIAGVGNNGSVLLELFELVHCEPGCVGDEKKPIVLKTACRTMLRLQCAVLLFSHLGLEEFAMILAIVGALLLALGLFSGAALVMAQLGVGGMAAGLSLWLMFPLFSVTGYLMFATGARAANFRAMSFAVSIALLVLAVGCAAALVADATALLALRGGTGALWYVLVIAGVLGASGAASHGRVAAQ